MRLFLFLVFLSATASAYGQGQAYVWKKNVSGDIDIRGPHTGRLARSPISDSSLAAIIINAIFSHKVSAYDTWGSSPRITNEQLKERFFGIIVVHMLEALIMMFR